MTLELGGNDPAIVLPDADPAEVAAGVFGSAFANNGQVCVAVKRLYVPRSLYSDVVDALTERALNAVVGDGLDEGVTHGPINNKPQLERVSELVKSAIADGARAATGGKATPGGGYFYPPTILAGARDGMAIVDEEQFGPALPVIEYDDVDAVIDYANASHFGLGSSVWTKDLARAGEFARRLETGTTWVNTHSVIWPRQPFGGVKWSGMGTENGREGLNGFTDLHVVHYAR